MTTPLPPDDDDLLAAEYVLGVLSLADRIAAENRVKFDPGFAALVANWENRLLPLAEAAVPVSPSADVLSRIETRLFPAAPRKSWLAAVLAIRGAALAAILVSVFFYNASPTPTYTATLAANDSPVSYLVQVSDGGISLALTGPAPNETQSHELWLIVGEAAPVSLGLIGPDPLGLPATLAPGMILAVSLEPAGGSPTGAPTGPVLALGPLEKI